MTASMRRYHFTALLSVSQFVEMLYIVAKMRYSTGNMHTATTSADVRLLYLVTS